MARDFLCPYLNTHVELTDERETHIADHHADLLPAGLDRLGETLREPDIVYQGRSDAILVFSRWYDSLRGKHLLVFVVHEPARSRHWIVTARYSRVPYVGDSLWKRS